MKHLADHNTAKFDTDKKLNNLQQTTTDTSE
jgi:hypothetical protein